MIRSGRPIGDLPISSIDKTAKGSAPTNVLASQLRSTFQMVFARVFGRVN